MEPKYLHWRVGGNFRLDALQAAVLRVKAPHLPGWTAARRRNADRYRALFADAGLEGTVTLPVETSGCEHVYNQFVIRSARRDELRAHLTERHIGTEIYYPLSLHRQPCYSGQAPASTSAGPMDAVPAPCVCALPLDRADEAAASSLALPIYGELTIDQQRHVVSSIREFFQ
jgi:dTDP-4-amino-4,6-dideoxygalactose transaminase